MKVLLGGGGGGGGVVVEGEIGPDPRKGGCR